MNTAMGEIGNSEQFPKFKSLYWLMIMMMRMIVIMVDMIIIPIMIRMITIIREIVMLTVVITKETKITGN